MEFQAEDPNHLLSYQRQIKQKELVELYHTGNAFKSVKSSVSTTVWGLSDPASCKDSAASEHCSYKAFLFTSYAFYSSPLIQEFMALRIYLWKSIIAMATVSCSKFWINAGIVQLLAFPSLRGATCFYLAQKMKGKPRAAALVEDFLPSVELVKFLRLCRAERLGLRSLSPQSSCIPIQLL